MFGPEALGRAAKIGLGATLARAFARRDRESTASLEDAAARRRVGARWEDPAARPRGVLAPDDTPRAARWRFRARPRALAIAALVAGAGALVAGAGALVAGAAEAEKRAVATRRTDEAKNRRPT
jgi:X-X-X-Leu-X-X-Gly heptad repeat protein